MQIQTLVDQFCDHAKYILGYSPDTIRRYRQTANLFRTYANVREIGQVTDQNVRGFFLHGRVQRGWEPNSFITYHKSLVVFFRWCVQQGHLAVNPADDVETPRVAKKLPPKLTRQDAHRLLEVVYNYPYKYRFLRYRNHAIFATFLFAGLRKNELLRLGLADVDLENLSIFVRRGKGAKDRVVPVCTSLAESLRRYLTERRRLGKSAPEFFCSLNRDIGFTETGLKRLVETMKRASRLQFSAHKLRHSFATLMLEGGCDIFSLSKMMGHSDIKTTTIYLAASPEHLRAQMVKHPLN